MTRDCFSFIFNLRDILLSLQMNLSFQRAAVACAITERSSEPLSKTTTPKYLELITVLSFCPFTFISLWMPLALFVIRLVFSALMSTLYLVQVLSRLSTRVPSSCSSSARAPCYQQTKIGYITAATAHISIMFFLGIRHDSFEKDVEEGG